MSHEWRQSKSAVQEAQAESTSFRSTSRRQRSEGDLSILMWALTELPTNKTGSAFLQKYGGILVTFLQHSNVALLF